MSYSVTILWGESPEPGDEPKTYTFTTEAERDAFLLGVDEGDGWHGHEIISESEDLPPDAPEEIFRCRGCGRPEDECSAEPCGDVIADRGGL